MKIFVLTFFASCLTILLHAQSGTINGQLLDNENAPVMFANVALHAKVDSSLVKVEVSDEEGNFSFKNLVEGEYFLKASFVGFSDVTRGDLLVQNDSPIDLGVLSFGAEAVDLATATVTARRAMVEVKPDRTVFNVEGTINSAGDNAIGLLRKAPGVLVDNNENITVLSRSGVLLYVDGKRLPLSGEDLANYLRTIPAEQIDRMDIITNPGAKYEAEGNAGIIDIRLKKNENEGANGSLTANATHGEYFRGNASASGNYRNGNLNVFGTVGYNGGTNFNTMDFTSFQNQLELVETNRMERSWDGINYRLGTDLFLGKGHTLGFLVTGRDFTSDNSSANRIEISQQASGSPIDSILVANNTADDSRAQNTYNLNYRFVKEETTLNIDADYGRYRNTSMRMQPNQYFDPGESLVLTEVINTFDTPRDIDIYTFKVDYETKLGSGKLGAGTKFSQVNTANTFLFFDRVDDVDIRNDRRSNQFDYDESVYAGYLNYSTSLGQKWNLSTGLRAELTNATGDLQAFLPELEEDPVDFNYLSWFPSVGLTYQVSQQNTLSLNYGRRINRPDYNVLNPFRNQLSQLSFEKGNAFLQPEIVNNYEIGYTLAYRYNFKLAYSRTNDQITRLIGPSEEDSRANFITWENLATQSVYSFNVSAPIQVTDKWNLFINGSLSHLDNQADYGGQAIVDVQAWTYSLFQQSTFTLPKGFVAEVSGWYSGPGVWGGVFKYDPSWSLNLGLQKKFFNNQLNVKLSAQDIFYESGWTGTSEFNGLVSTGAGNWDSRQVSLSLNYNFGNQNIKSRKRRTGLEAESQRVGGDQ